MFLLHRLVPPLQENADDQTASDLAVVLFETATLRSGYQLADTKAYGDRIERMLRLSMNVDLDEQVRHTPAHALRRRIVYSNLRLQGYN